MRRVKAFMVLCATLAGCSEVVGPEYSLQVTVIARPGDRVSVGQEVELVGVAYNPTVVTIKAGRGCGPGIAVLVTSPRGESHDLSAGPHLCPLLDNHRIAPGETDFEAYDWTPDAPGMGDP